MIRWLRHPAVWLPVSVALLGLVAWRSRVWEVPETLRPLDPGPLVLAVALNAVILLAWAARSADLLAAAGRPVPVWPLVPMTAFANAINNLTPGSVGELVRLYLLRAHHAVDYLRGGAVILIERFVALGYLTASAIVAWVVDRSGLAWPVAGLGFVVVAALPGVLYRLGVRPFGILAAVPLGGAIGRGRWDRGAGILRRLDATIAGVLHDPARATIFAALTAIVLVTYTAQLLLVGAAVGVRLDPLATWGALGLGMTAGVLSLLPFGLGSTDLVVVALLEVAGVPGPTAVAMTFGYRLVSTLPLGLAGVASYALLAASLPESGAAGAARAAGEALNEPAGENLEPGS